ncbi:hypothetical protein I5G62_gp94 [Mycobacterium phage CRB2]|uniref:Phage zinc binding domain-containing protein n=1 Tax=Mycobacterium phage CRB2 TaxID=2483623 RepID=A0A455LSQ8_9CAUD|nr:hypothetical protein I5G62_gp94 [Mycobacterium phage CRB2]AYP70080.1 hypothetical protein CRB2_94 [Mycobacterium phage CRB2]
MGWININGVPHPDWFFAEECPCANDRPEDCAEHAEQVALEALPASQLSESEEQDARAALAGYVPPPINRLTGRCRVHQVRLCTICTPPEINRLEGLLERHRGVLASHPGNVHADLMVRALELEIGALR